jgi:predicted Fe-Mo cluster-binding NifX family protein
VKICIACAYPGGPDAAIVDTLELSEMLDFYDLHENGKFEHTAQTRNCLVGCADPIETIVRRGTERVVVLTLSPDSLLKLTNSGVRVFRTDATVVRSSLDLLSRNGLTELDRYQFSKLQAKQKEDF